MHNFVDRIVRNAGQPAYLMLRRGWREIRVVLGLAAADDIVSSGLFDADWYRRTQARELSQNADPVQHYLRRGARQGLIPGPSFDGNWYLAQNPDVASAGLNPLLHYIRQGRAEGRHACAAADPAELEAVRLSGLFDADWYRRTQAPELAQTADAAQHYLCRGARRGLNPGPSFDGNWYLAQHPDVGSAGPSPLLHYIRHGRAEGRQSCSAADPAELQAVRLSGLFDADWYRRTQAPELAQTADPVLHYLCHGARRGLNPGPLFDGDWYLAQHRDVAAAEQGALLHYARAGRQENRRTRNVGAARMNRGRPSLAVSLPGTKPTISQIAVVVHAFYPDMFDALCLLLRNIPVHFALLVAVPDDAAKRVVEQSVAHHGIRAHLNCRVAPNRGRNFGSFLATFASQVLLHDLVLHLHTKRSLYTGTDRAGWRSALYEGLVGTEPLVRLIIGLFEQDPKLGLYYPATYADMPYWAHHWLQNAHHGSALLQRIGVTEYPRSGYLDFPVGGMFWARVDALRPLLEAGIVYDDFPEEAGQTDGTLAHAIERVIGILPHARGYNFVEYDHESGSFCKNLGNRNIDQYSHSSPAGFEAAAATADLVSFDIFDTLVSRPALTPDAVLRYVGHKLVRAHAAPPNFFLRRKRAEDLARAAKSGKGDVDLGEIYAAFAPDEGWTHDLVAQSAALERSTDWATLRPRPGAAEMVRCARGLGRRIVAISDTYYTRGDIDRILDRSGFSGAFDAIYISSVEQARKDRRDLWSQVMRAEHVARERWLHVGDNEQSDIQAASDLGLRSFHVMHPATMLEQEGFSRSAATDASRWAADLVVGPAMLRLTGSPFRNGRPWREIQLSDARDVGYVIFGPIIFMFMAWLVRHPALRPVEQLYFLSREGYLLHQIYAGLCRRFPQIGLPPGDYFYASRRATLSAVQSTRFHPERITSAPFQGNIQELLVNRIGFAPPAAFGLAEWQVQLPRDEKPVIAVLEALRSEIVAHAIPESHALKSHAQQAGMHQGRMLGLVDIGYSATIQKNLQEIMNLPFVGFYMGSFDTAHEVEAQSGYAFGCCDEGIAPWTSRSPVLQHSLLVESFLTAPHGQVLSFGQDGTGPKFKSSSLNQEEACLLAQMHEGATAYCDELLDIYGPDLLFADIELLMPQQFLEMLVNGQIVIPDELRTMLRVEDDFCGNGEIAAVDRSMELQTHQGAR